MMGPKTLSEIRDELWQHLSRDGQDPIEWVEQQLAASPDNRVLAALLALLKRPMRPGPAARKARPVEETESPPPPPDDGEDVLHELLAFSKRLMPLKPRPKKPRPARKR